MSERRDFSGLSSRPVSFACGSFGCAVRIEAPGPFMRREVHEIADHVREALRFHGLTLEQFLLLAEFCDAYDVMDLTYETFDSAVRVIERAS